jgi:uncharacterized protein YbjT (DUF2867 family)
MKVIIFGATGMVGEGVLQMSIADSTITDILVIGRRPCEYSHPKVREVLHRDFYNFDPLAEEARGYDACFFCLGVSSIGKSEPEYTRLTYDLTMSAARMLSKVNPLMVFCYVSGLGTDSTEKGKVMWARVKGKTENDLKKLPFRAVYNFRPGFIRPIPGSKRTIWPAKVLVPAYPLLKTLFKNGVVTLEEVGRAMIRVSSEGNGFSTLECRDISWLGRNN